MKVVVDWDGTVTKTDGLDLVLNQFGDPQIYDAAENRLGKDLTLHEVIALEFESVRVPLDDVVSWVRENVVLRAGFHEFARRHRPLVLSSGFHELIDPVLDREGLDLEVVANRVDAHRDGWRARFRNDESCEACGQPCKRAEVRDWDEFVYVGDGYSDRCVALAATRVFARDGLAEFLTREGVAFERFEDFHDIE